MKDSILIALPMPEPSKKTSSDQPFESVSLSMPIYREIIAVTGTIGSGKSSVVKLLAERGAFVQSADLIAKELVLPGQPALEEIAATLGREVLLAEGGLDRSKLRSIIFSQPEKKLQLEAILHPRIKALAEERFREAFRSGRDLLVYEVPLLFEAGLHSLGFKSIVVVAADDDVCISRVMKRDGSTFEAAKKIVDTQFPAEVKRKMADFVIENSGAPGKLAEQIDELLRRQQPQNPA